MAQTKGSASSEKDVDAAPRPIGRPRTNHDEIRSTIIKSARELFAQRGFSGTSIRQITEGAGLSHGVFYHYIDSKEDLLVEILHSFTDGALTAMRTIAQMDAPVEERLVALSRELVRSNAEHVSAATILQNEWKTLQGRPQYDKVVERRREFEQLLRDLLVEGQQVGSFADVDPTIAALAFWGIHNYMYQWYRPDGRRSQEEIAEAFGRIFLQGIRAV